MSSTKVIVSDLHLADGHPIFDNFTETSQAALEGLLAAASPTGPLGRANDVELIINGDCFDILATPPYDTGATIDVATALVKMHLIASTHKAFFETLQAFLALPGRRVTFIAGNHDIELRFAEVRAFIAQVMGIEPGNDRLSFCAARFYQPLPDVYIEHGNQFDFWNRTLPGIWDERGQPLDLHPQTIALCPGSRYFQHTAHALSLAYPYFDHMEPSMNILRQMALLCLLNPAIVKESLRHTEELISEPYQSLAHLSPDEISNPQRLFQEAMLDFAAFQRDMERQFGETPPAATNTDRVQADRMTEFMMLNEALKLPLLEAAAAVCTPATYQMGEDVARGMHNELSEQPALRYAIAGHTHMVRIDPVHNGMQSYLNTGSWTIRLAPPAPGEMTPALVEWLREPDWSAIPLRDVTQRVFALVADKSDEKQVQQTPSSATLCVWEGGRNGSYRVLA